jgi:hypothetical protein
VAVMASPVLLSDRILCWNRAIYFLPSRSRNRQGFLAQLPA